MMCKILHESRGRIRVHIAQGRMTLEHADKLEYYLKSIDGITDVKIYDRTGNATVSYLTDRTAVINALAAFSFVSTNVLIPGKTTRALNRQYEDKLVFSVLQRILIRAFLPAPIRLLITSIKAFFYLCKGIRSLILGKLDVSVLDAAAISVSMLRGEYETAASIMFMLGVGETIEEWTYKKSVEDLARTMSLQIDKVWLKLPDGEILTPVGNINVGDHIVVRTGNVIPLDGKIICGEAMVNQASITGESLPVHKKSGSYVYAGTVIEEGDCVVCVDKNLGTGRYDRIVRMIEESEKLKSNTEEKAFHLADKLVPYSFAGMLLTYLVTRNVSKALSILMVDFSCALKLAMPIAVLTAMRESSYYNITVKGGRFLEAVSEANTFVLDKTGTLTYAAPTLAKVITFEGRDEGEMLRLAACLEEHYPHSMAKAVVSAAEARGLRHEEYHSEVEYDVAHGISSTVDGERVVIGSSHFIFQHESCLVNPLEQQKLDALPSEYSHLYLAISGRLAAVLCVEDPLRVEAAAVITSLKKLGVNKIVMMTGDNDATARAIAAEVGIDEYYAQVLPEDKASYIRTERLAGRSVVMIGDGVNDSPALSEADVGIAISDGAAIAREIADITISADDLFALVTLKSISDALMERIRKKYRFIIGFNLLLISLGIGGVISPGASAFFHNISTLGISLHCMTNLLD